MKFPKSVFVLALFAAGLPGLHAQALLEDFSTMRKNGINEDLWSVTQSEDPGQTWGLDNGAFRVTGSPQTGCTYIGCGLYPQFMPWGPSGYIFPGGYAQNYIKSGSWDANYNRLQFRFKCNANVGGQGGGSGNVQIGTYIRPHGNGDSSWQGDHFYHFIDPNVYSGQWIDVQLNRVPQWEVGYPDNNYNFPEDADWSNGVHYFDGLTRFYFDTQYSGWSNVTCWFDDFKFAKVTGEPETYVSSTTAQYSGSRYEVTWAAPRQVTNGQAYSIRYSTTGSMKASGFASGIDGGTVRGPASSSAVSTFWNSPAMPQAANMWIAIQPAGQSSFTEILVSASGATAPPPTASACDVNGDGAVNSSDVTLAINQAIGAATPTGDLNGDGVWDVVDVQRVINAANGGTCRVGP